METVAVDAVRDDLDGGKFAAAFLAQPAESAFKLGSGKLRVGDDAVGVSGRGRILFVGDLAVQRDVTDDLQAVPTGPENAEILAEGPDVLVNENQRGIDLCNKSFRLESRKHVAAFGIGRIDRETAIVDGFAGVADGEIVDLMTIREPPHDVLHHPRQTGAVRVEADGYQSNAGSSHRHDVFMWRRLKSASRICWMMPARCEEQSPTFQRTRRPCVPVPDNAEPRIAQGLDQHIDGKFLDPCKGENRLLRGGVLADLEILPADFVKFAADFVDQLEPLRGQQNRPFRPLAVQLEQSYTMGTVVAHAVDKLVERDLGDGFATAPDDRAVSRVENSFEARIAFCEHVITVEAQLVGISVGPPHRASYKPHMAVFDGTPQVFRRDLEIRAVGFDADDVLAPS